MQEPSPTGTTVGVMLMELIRGIPGLISGDSDTGKCQSPNVPLDKIQKRIYPRKLMVILMV